MSCYSPNFWNVYLVIQQDWESGPSYVKYVDSTTFLISCSFLYNEMDTEFISSSLKFRTRNEKQNIYKF